MTPKKIILHKRSHTLEIAFDNNECFILPCAYLRAHSPSAEMRYEDQSFKNFDAVNILSIEPVGQYGIKLIFSDGHRTGIYSWDTLYTLGKSYEQK